MTLSLGDEITVSEMDDTKIDGSLSYDPDDEDGNASYVWQAFNSKNQPLMDKTGRQRLKLSRTPVLLFPEGILKAGQT